ncbi:MAG: hypothetical protein B7Y56_03030 [Gallionellales bacterium 35-53-114]|jgi:hypothetical protein|nr:MAG: hypothetical protein B7Y56_03030 [Gallionellales bacterium 35-53-114]OYZ65081.1 MAG: hypothetical protein B7Y04_00190 [Gallionellales bacterium 24-53-125]OZB07990.1 MAG: hypothetical protein B7X61_10640 [Gallionellales bacterium 39-52-133]HQS59731.1 DUF3168 domain-containing protein [Gallionellaceae bacterium]HQS76485.1 DUF3168 domain-containing protein [Gallionellaceae bacterium]
MTTESLLNDVLKTLVSNRVYPDVAPELTARPYITYQQVGGESANFVDPTVPTKKNSRFQVNVWADTRAAAAALAIQVEDALRVVTALQTTVLSAPVATYDQATEYKGTRQDFSFWN